ncbi:aminomethyltransferase family protein [Corynebacterium sp.]|uniref:aminomethyltransferase family protein n=1 Tax=Corynebacterium sp. TaxID=1720 RepID=UPI0026DB88B9|nr:glycine cleavage T C-terminal barrel domain-containing protein [Corynebacterium sp.]MDO4610535.1 glycine cleavage T C-terminal barrel domain-containing protein [Corynebacterium sp.]
MTAGTLVGVGGTAAAPGTAVATRSLRGPLHDRHRALGAVFADHGGWLMPESYGDPVGEHLDVRAAAGLFDLSHLGGIQVTGPEAALALDYALLGDMARMPAGAARYTLMLDPAGGIIDDMVIYAPSPTEILVVPTAARASVVADELVARTAEFQVEVADVAAASFQLAVQGPRSREILEEAGAWRERGAEPAAERTCRFTVVGGCPVLIGSMSYTGEEGFEIIGRVGDAGAVWSALLAVGVAHGLRPAGLLARSTLRIEAVRPRVGAEMDRTTTPYDVGLRHLVPHAKEEQYVGREGLVAALQDGTSRTVAGLLGDGRVAPAPGAPVTMPDDGRPVGVITSSCLGPSAGAPVALALMDAAAAREGGWVLASGVPMRVTEPPLHLRDGI